ncbi:MAG TPA: dipeptidase [Saprospiraceae bacterium]|nr:dipeptidase [Saprospiraceae bacterium]
MKNTQTYIQEHHDDFLEDMKMLLRIPSVSADPHFKKDVVDAAKATAQLLKGAGLRKVKIHKTKGHPIVYGERIIDKKQPTVLIYGHYDVQPADPVELWDTPPFEPVVKTTKKHPMGAVYARGAADDKGQFLMHVEAVKAMIATNELPCNVKFMIEGEEEVGSIHLGDFCKANKKMLACDVILISDTSIISNKTPSITVGLRGLSYVEVEVTGPNRDLHSGVYGGAVANPINILAKMIAQLHDEDNHITIPGFYDDVKVFSQKERDELNKAPFSEAKYKRDLGIREVYGEKGYTTIERTGIRPTLDVNGIWGGYIGEGAKTVLPSKAYAKISMRLIPNQDPKKITRLFAKYFKSLAPKAVKVKVTPHHGGSASVTPIDSIEYLAAAKALQTTFKKDVIPQMSGGSIPIVALFSKVLKVNTVLMGFGLDSDAIHSPNEHYGLFNFYKGIETIPYFFANYVEMKN